TSHGRVLRCSDQAFCLESRVHFSRGHQFSMIVHLITTECVNDGRVMRAAQTVKALGQAVVVLARSKSDVPLEETIGGVTIRRLKLGTARLPRRQPFQTVKFAELHRKLVSEAVDLRPAVVHAHDLSALPLGVAVAKRSRARLIYDSHELWSSIIGGKYGAAMAGMICALERRWAGRADAIVTVSDAIAHRLAQQFQVTLPMV